MKLTVTKLSLSLSLSLFLPTQAAITLVNTTAGITQGSANINDAIVNYTVGSADNLIVLGLYVDGPNQTPTATLNSAAAFDSSIDARTNIFVFKNFSPNSELSPDSVS